MSSHRPHVDDIQVYLVAHNGWSVQEFEDFTTEQAEYINEDGTTNLTHDEWTRLAAGHSL